MNTYRSSIVGTLVGGVAALLAAWVLLAAANAAEPTGRSFATAEQAVGAMVAALRSNDQRNLVDILGPGSKDLVSSGDPVADRDARERLLHAYGVAHHVEMRSADEAVLVIGEENWSWPIPIVRSGAHWRFDSEAGAQRIIDRRIGRNELNVVEVCRAFVEAQREYAAKDEAGGGLHEYAAKFESSPGKHDGLYWHTAAGEVPSPLGPLVAKARAEGYAASKDPARPVPYHGYYYRILTRQGAHAPGGAKSYVLNGHMTGGFALLAVPAKWGDSGIMTFLVNQQGIVFQKNLGPDTERIAAQITKFDPDPSWSAQ